MTASKTTVLRCDTPQCPETVTALPRESDLELRRRAARDQGWRFSPSLAHGGHTDLCRWHG